MEDKLINFEELWDLFKRRWWIIVIITALTTSLAVLKVRNLQPTYTASAKIFIGKGENYKDFYSQQEMSYYSNLLTTFSEIIKIDDFLTETLDKYYLKISPSLVKNNLSFSGSENSPIYTISYSSWQKDDMKDILWAICKEFRDQVKDIMPETKPRIIDTPKVYTIYPDKRTLPKMAVGVGIVLSIGLILVLDYLDDKIRRKNDLTKAIPVPIIGEIPSHENQFKREAKNVRSKPITKINIGGGV